MAKVKLTKTAQKKERDDLNKKMKMYKTLPIMTAMSAVLILL